MPTAPSSESGRPARKSRARLWLFAGAGALASLIAGGALLWAFRGPVGVALAVHYLKGRGVPAAIEIEQLDLKGFVGKARLGPPQDPDLTVDRIEVEFEPIPIFKSGLAAPRIRSLKLTHPRLKARWDGKTLTFGTLQPLLDEAMAKPGAGPGPQVTVENGEARLSTPYGLVVARGGALLDKGRLVSGQGRLLPARLTLGGERLALSAASLTLAGNDAQLVGRLTAQAAALEGGFQAGPSRINLGFALPYGADGLARFDGPMNADLAAVLEAPRAGEAAARTVKLDAKLSGRLSGPVDTLAANLSGQVRLNGERVALPGRPAIPVLAADAAVQGLALGRTRNGLRATAARLEVKTGLDRITAGMAAASAPRLDLVLEQAEAGVEGKAWRIASPLSADAFASRVSAGDLTLPSVAAKASGRVALASGEPLNLSLSGSATSGPGGMSAKAARDWGAALASLGDEARIAAALRGARLTVPAWSLTVAEGATAFRLGAPARLGAASLSRADLHLGADGRGAGTAALSVAGQGLPSFSLSSASFTLGRDGAVAAPLQLKLAFSGPLLHGVEAAGSARLSGRAGAFALALPGCVPVTVASVGEESPPLAAEARVQLCPEGGPALGLGPRGWRARLALRDGQAKLPVSEASASGGRGLLTLAGQGAPETGRLVLETLRLTDAAAETRFRPLTAAGTLDLNNQVWAGDMRIREAALGRAVALVHVRQAMGAAEGSAEIDASDLNFQPGALQPVDLSPIAGMISEVKAETRFTGRIDWKDDLVTSSGRFDTEGAAFRSQFGQVTGAVAHIRFDSLLPVTAPAGQVFTADQVDWIAPLTNVAARFGLTEISTKLEGASATLGSGKATLGPMEIPFEEGGRLRGRAELKAVDLGELIAGSSLAASVAMQGKIDAAVPFDIGPDGFRIADGFAVSTGPGRLSIQRAALTGAMASGGGTAGAPPNAVQDFAYQALENLAFDSLEAKIDSRPQGRLGVVFRIKGRNDPPVAKDPVINLFDLLRGKAFDKPIPLPKGTPVDLTLDTSLNFDELLKAYSDYSTGKDLGGSGAVQPK